MSSRTNKKDAEKEGRGTVGLPDENEEGAPTFGDSSAASPLEADGKKKEGRGSSSSSGLQLGSQVGDDAPPIAPDANDSLGDRIRSGPPSPIRRPDGPIVPSSSSGGTRGRRHPPSPPPAIPSLRKLTARLPPAALEATLVRRRSRRWRFTTPSASRRRIMVSEFRRILVRPPPSGTDSLEVHPGIERDVQKRWFISERKRVRRFEELSEPLLRVQGLAVDSTKLQVPLLEVHADDRIGIRGRSGIGKTQLLRALARLDPFSADIHNKIDHGNIMTLDGRSWEDISPARLRTQIIWVSQDRPLLSGTPRAFYEQLLKYQSRRHPKSDDQNNNRLTPMELARD